MKRNLSGIYFRYQNPENKKWENWCFEDLPEVEQDKILFANDNPDWLRSLAKSLAIKLTELGEHFDIVAE
jgi:hypothetical protein